jgi:hypothetical protein
MQFNPEMLRRTFVKTLLGGAAALFLPEPEFLEEPIRKVFALDSTMLQRVSQPLMPEPQYLPIARPYWEREREQPGPMIWDTKAVRHDMHIIGHDGISPLKGENIQYLPPPGVEHRRELTREERYAAYDKSQANMRAYAKARREARQMVKLDNGMLVEARFAVKNA